MNYSVFFTRVICVIFYVLACHTLGLLIRKPFIGSANGIFLAFCYVIPFGYAFGVDGKLLLVMLMTMLFQEIRTNGVIFFDAILLLFVTSLYVEKIIKWYCV